MNKMKQRVIENTVSGYVTANRLGNQAIIDFVGSLIESAIANTSIGDAADIMQGIADNAGLRAENLENETG